MASQRGKDIVN